MFGLFRKYIAAVQIINQSMNQSMKKVSVFWNDKNESLSKLKGLITG